MNDLELLHDHGPDAPPASSATLSRARQLLVAEMTPVRRRRDGRSAILERQWIRPRIAAAVAAVVVAASAGAYAMLSPHHTPADRSTGVRLVAYDAPAYPVGLRPRPSGLGAPAFSGGLVAEGPGADRPSMTAVFPATDGVSDVYLVVGDRYIPQGAPEVIRSVSVRGLPGFVVEHREPPASVVLSWQRKPGQWLTLTGHGRFGTEAAVQALAATVVDDVQPVPLQVRLAPAGWQLAAYKDDRIVTLRDPASGEELTVYLVRTNEENLMGAVRKMAGVSTVQVNGRDSDLAQNQGGWCLEAPLPDGSAFHLHAPASLTREQVVAVADQVVVTPKRR